MYVRLQWVRLLHCMRIMDSPVKVSSLNEAEKKSVDAAIEAKTNAYCPYSKFYVGAALIAESGEIYKGCNVENASYPLSTCAERTAIVKAVSNGEKSIKSIAVVTSDSENFASPCGGCRQIIYEFGGDNDCTVLLVKHPGEDCIKTTIKQLLPRGFGPECLKH